MTWVSIPYIIDIEHPRGFGFILAVLTILTGQFNHFILFIWFILSVSLVLVHDFEVFPLDCANRHAVNHMIEISVIGK